ncbi:MAG: hypothetical protein IJN56_06440 [Clostridia bacterium]|nr:hypothetical protein [Clostridia bacterium]
MKKIFDGKIYELMPKTDGIIFPYQKAVVDEGDIVWYKMLSFENQTMTDVSETVFWNIKFGSNYPIALKLCKNFVSLKSIILPNGRLFLCDEKGQVFIIDNDGLINIGGELKYRDEMPSSIAFHKNSIWASFSSTNVLIRFNINTMRAELRIGGKSSPFNNPQNIFIDGDIAYVCNNSTNSIVRVDLESYSVDDYYSFEEGVHSFIKSGSYEFALLDSGLYLI